MKIGIDISMLVYQGSGVATYTYHFVKSLLTFDKKNEYKLFYSSLRRPENLYHLEELETSGAKVYSYRFPPTLIKLWWNRSHIIPVEWFLGDLDVFHSSDYLRPPLSARVKAITTLHDLTWKKFPEYHTNDVIAAHARKLEKTVRYGDMIMVDSLQTKSDLIHFYPEIEKKNIFVNYPGVDDRFTVIKDQDKIKKVLAKYRIRYPQRYLLYVGAIEPRKNLETAIHTYAEFIKRKKHSDFEFLLVGRAGWKNEHIFQLVKDLRLQEKITFVGFVKDEDLVYFYNAAKALVYLSLYEGFGLPPLEAAQCRIPSLIYANSSLKEVMPEDYLFTKKGKELQTLIQLVEDKGEIDRRKREKFNWSSYCTNFLNIVETH